MPKTLGLDWDGVIHAYTGWKGLEDNSGGPVPGAMDFLRKAVEGFDEVAIYSSRSRHPDGIAGMLYSLKRWLTTSFGKEECDRILLKISFPTCKPQAYVSLDDRGITFNGAFPTVADLLAFRPWWKLEWIECSRCRGTGNNNPDDSTDDSLCIRCMGNGRILQ